jgi:hypothetical protein
MNLLSLRSFGALALLAATTAHAADINNIGALNQTQFRALSEDLGAVVSYKPLVPAETLGLIGFDLGVAVTGTSLEHRDLLSLAAGGSSVPKILPLVSARAVKGLPFNFDIGVALGGVPNSNVRTAGGELRWAFIDGGMVLPAIAVRGAINQLSGVDQLKVNTSSIDVSISKGFLMFTPYAGVGTVHVKTKAPGTTLANESFNKSKVFAGVNVNLGLVNLAAETDKTGDNTSYGVKVGFRF